MSTCSKPECGRPVAARTLCMHHYNHAYAAGLPMPPRKRDKPLIARFADSTARNPVTGCLEWQLALDSAGYGLFWVNQAHAKAHRWAWEQVHGAVPGDKELDHLCRNRRCAEVTHLEPVTSRENTLRGTGFAAVNARKTHCVHGHPFDGTNTLRTTKGRRRCRACKNANGRARRAAA